MSHPHILACDRCHYAKERCVREQSNQNRCRHCTRLNRSCGVLRAVLPRGRRRPRTLPPGEFFWINQGPECPSHNSIPSLLESHLSNEQWLLSDEALVEYMRSIDHFLNYFILGPYFSTHFQILVESRFSEFPDLVREGCLACAGAVFQARSQKSGFDDINFVRSAGGIRKLRRAHVTERDAGAFSTLGLALTTFDLITSGTSAHTITQFTLSSIRPLYPSLWRDSNVESEILCLIFMDTVECLLRRQIPVLRYMVRDWSLVDRLMGLCAPLLPIMYDICQFAYESRTSSPVQRQFGYLNKLVASWQPQPPADLIDKFSPQEVTCLLGQANVFKAAISLALHRLQHPFGVEDLTATRLATQIFSVCAVSSRMAGEADKLPQTLFPLDGGRVRGHFAR
jgi:hypothetical protein